MTAGAIIDAMNGVATLVASAWGAKPLAVPNMPFDDAALDAKSASWARLTILHSSGEQTTLAGNVGNARFGRTGVIIVQCFSPLGIGLKRAYNEAETVLAAFEGKRTADDVWFRNCRIEEVGESGAWYQINVVVEFTYEQRG